MDGLVCDACGETLLIESDVRYVLKIEGLAAYDPLEITQADLEKDLEGEMKRLLEALATKSAEEAEEEVYKLFRFDLCPRCWRRYARDPLEGLKKKSQGD